ncbi:hypothetical protein BGY98DRAFT_912681, partial [Russula aff. rugulosa BPL654]
GVELLREGEQHSGRFSGSGLYGTTLPLSDYIILDGHNTRPASTRQYVYYFRISLIST